MDAAVAGIGLMPVLQPIVSLQSGHVVGFEALARWPSLRDPAPSDVFSHAASRGSLGPLDRHCVDAAIGAAIDGGLPTGTLLLINREPNTPVLVGGPGSAIAEGRDRFQLTFEVTERGVLEHPRALMRNLEAMRAQGVLIALDDVGADDASLMLLDVVAPDIVKLDLLMIQSTPGRPQARAFAATLDYAERTGATIVAEGIETERHLEMAVALGASLGQGYRFGRPGATWSLPSDRWTPSTRRRPFETGTDSPFDTVHERSALKVARKDVLLAMSSYIESQARHALDAPMLLATMQHIDNFAPSVRRRYGELASRSPLIAVFAVGADNGTTGGVRTVPVGPADALAAEWAVIALGPHTAAALIARELDDDATVDDCDRRFEFVLTYDRQAVVRAVRSLLARIP